MRNESHVNIAINDTDNLVSLIIVSIVREELTLGDLKPIELTIFVVKFWVDDVVADCLLEFLSTGPHGHSHWFLGHLWHELTLVAHRLLFLLLKAVSAEVFKVVCRVSIDIDSGLEVSDLRGKVLVVVVGVSPFLKCYPLLCSTFDLARSRQRHA